MNIVHYTIDRFDNMIQYFNSPMCEQIATSSILDTYKSYETAQTYAVLKDRSGIAVAYFVSEGMVIREEV